MSGNRVQVAELFYKNNEATERIIINQGGTSSGKTYSILELLIATANNDPGCLISVVSETFPHLRKGAMRDFFNILDEWGLYNPSHHNKTEVSYKIGKSTIEFFSADQEARVRGPRRDYLFINEANNISFETFTQLNIRTRKKIWIDFNPVSEFWAHTELSEYDPETKTGRDNVKWITSTYQDNPFLDPNIVREIETRKDDPRYANWWRVYGEGKVGNMEGLVFPAWDYVDEMPHTAGTIGLDFGFTNDPTGAVLVVRSGDTLYLDELIYETGLTNPMIAKRIKEMGYGSHEIVCDSAEPKSIAELRAAGLNVLGVHKTQDSIRGGIAILNNYHLKVTKRSTNLVSNLRNYQWEFDKGMNRFTNYPIDAHNDTIDPIRYVALTKLKPRRFGLSRSN